MALARIAFRIFSFLFQIHFGKDKGKKEKYKRKKANRKVLLSFLFSVSLVETFLPFLPYTMQITFQLWFQHYPTFAMAVALRLL